MKALGVLTWIAISSLISALVHSWMMQCLWRWFLARQYGPGPTMGAWFGIATIAGFVIYKATRTRTKGDDRTIDEIIWDSVKETVSMWFGCLLVLGIAWCTGSLIGWVS